MGWFETWFVVECRVFEELPRIKSHGHPEPSSLICPCPIAANQLGTYYNGLTHDEIIAGGNTKNGINEWCKAGGIAGRGVLLDWVRWKTLTQPDQPLPSPVERFEIPHTDLEEVAKFQGVTFEVGDIPIIRSGFVRWHNNADEEERKRGTLKQATYIGVKATDEAVEWFW